MDDEFLDDVHAVFHEAEGVLVTKHEDYGPKNISDAPGGPINGIRVRLHDKFSRLAHLYDNEREPNHESIADTWLDIMNYAAIAILVERGQWPK